MAKASHFAKRDRQRQNQTEDCKEARVARTTVSMHRGQKIIECSVLIITVCCCCSIYTSESSTNS